MALITLEEAKAYLRVDSSYDDGLISALLSAAEMLCVDVARLEEEEWQAVNSASEDEESGTIPTEKLENRRKLMKVAVLYALGYFYEHREEADHHDLTLTLRSLLFSIREGAA